MKKQCSRCKNWHNIEDFYKCKANLDGLHSWCRFCKIQQAAKWQTENPERYKARIRKWHEQDPVRNRTTRGKYRNKNKERLNEAARKRYAELRKERQKQRQAWARERRRINPQYRLSQLLRCRLYQAVRRKNGLPSAVRDIGMPIAAFLVYLNLDALDKYGIPYTGNEKLFHIDHIRPLASFNLLDPEQLKIAVRWDNLQVLTIKENLSKSDN